MSRAMILEGGVDCRVVDCSLDKSYKLKSVEILLRHKIYG